MAPPCDGQEPFRSGAPIAWAMAVLLPLILSVLVGGCGARVPAQPEARGVVVPPSQVPPAPPVPNASQPTTLPAHPAPTRVNGAGGSLHAIAVTGTLAYIAQSNHIVVVDFSDPSHARQLARIPLVARVITIAGPLAYVASLTQGLQILDLHIPAAPVVIGGFATPGTITDIEVVGDLAYVVQENAPAQIIDVRNPQHTVVLSSLPPTSAIAVSGQMAYLVSGTDRLLIVDVHTPASPHQVGQYLMPDGVSDVAADGSIAYVAGSDGVRILDLHEPARPILLATYPASAGATSVHLAGSTVYASLFVEGMCLLDVRNSAAPRLITCFGMMPGHLALSGTRAYLQGASSLSIVDLSDPAAPRALPISFPLWYDAWALQAIGTHLYVAANDEGLQILDMRLPEGLPPLGHYDTPGRAVDVQVAETIAYVADVSSVQILDVSDPTNPTLLSSIPTPESVLRVQVADKRLYLIGGDGNDEIRVFDVQTPAQPKPLGSFFLGIAGSNNIAVIGQYVYVPTMRGIMILDMHDPAAITQIEQYPASGGSDRATEMSVQDIQLVDTYVYVTATIAGAAELLILDVRDPVHPLPRGHYTISQSDSSRISVMGATAYLIEMNRLSAIDVRDPAMPAQLWSIATGGFDAQAVGDWLYVGTQGEGLVSYWMGEGPVPTTSAP